VNDPATVPGRRIRVWDLPTRLFHWTLVAAVAAMWWSAENHEMDLHLRLGTFVVGLLAFRLAWGVLGGSTARFASFVRGPRAAIDYLRGRSGPAIGHNPLGGWSVIAMIALLCAQVGLGLFASDEDGFAVGPLSNHVSYETARDLAELHEILFNVLLALIALHVAAILFYALVRKDNLVGPMIHGRREAPEGAEELNPAGPVRFLVALAFAVLATLLLTRWL